MTLVSRVLGLVRDMIIARFFGAGFVSDAFFVAFKVPHLLRRLVSEGSLGTAFVPFFSQELSDSDGNARRTIGAVTSFVVLFTLGLVVVGMIFAMPITLGFAPGFGSAGPKIELAASLLRTMLPYVILVSLLALVGGILNVLGYFALPAASPAILNLTIIAFLVLLYQKRYYSKVENR